MIRRALVVGGLLAAALLGAVFALTAGIPGKLDRRHTREPEDSCNAIPYSVGSRKSTCYYLDRIPEKE